MRAIALLPLLCVCASTVLAVLCLMAGYKSDFMENFELITFNTSLLGEGLIEAAAQEVASGETATTVNVPPALQSALASTLLSNSELIQEIAEKLNIHDFYKIHMLDFCEGYYEPGPIPNASYTNPSQNVTFCSPPQAFSFFNATQVLTDELLPGVSLDQIQFPSQVQDAITAMAVVQKVMFVLYCTGAGISGLAALEAIIAFLIDGRLSAVCNAILDIVSITKHCLPRLTNQDCIYRTRYR